MMLKEMRPMFIGVLPVMFLGLALGLSVSSVAARNSSDDECARITAIDLNTTTRDFDATGHVSGCFESYIPAGMLFLDVGVSGQVNVDAKLAFHGRALGSSFDDRSGFAYLERSAASLLAEVRVPGRYLFCVTSQDTSHPLQAFKLKTSFVSGLVLSTKDGDPDEDEPPPDPFSAGSACGRLYGAGLTFSTKDGDPDEDELTSDPKLLLGVEVIRESLCQAGETDDHGDVQFCATPVVFGESVSGEIRNRSADDDDYFVLFVSRLRTVFVETMGQFDTLGGLYDHRGYRIATDDDSGDGNNFRIIKILSPGVYYVRIEGRDRQEGVYRLSVETRR